MSNQLLADGVQLGNSSPQEYRINGECDVSAPTSPGVHDLHALRSLTYSITAVTELTALHEYAPALNELARAASERNVFYEPWMLLRALKAFGQKSSFAFVLVFGEQVGKPALLCGFFPLETMNRYRGLPLRVARFWSYLHFYWCPPLIRKGCERKCLEAVLQWLRSDARQCSLVEFISMPAEGPLAQALVEVVNELGLPRYIPELYTRALLLRTDDAEACIRSALPGHRLKELNRVRRRLAEQGPLTFEQITLEANLSEWIEGFLGLEAQGWKGKAGTAMAATAAGRDFFAECVRAAFARDQLMMLRLRLNDRPIAYKCNFLSRPGSFAFKIAYDEAFASYSPGVHLELENIRRFHALEGVEWMDSCAAPGHFMANHLWAERKTIQTTVIAVRGWFNELQLSMLPFLKWAKRSGSALTAKETKEDL
jgi:CelD/BcsL family acetyltransferase involved in cellulose biosynthesis